MMMKLIIVKIFQNKKNGIHLSRMNWWNTECYILLIFSLFIIFIILILWELVVELKKQNRKKKWIILIIILKLHKNKKVK